MRPQPTSLPWLLWLALVASCTSPPKPPTVDESLKRQVNSASAIELQVCRHELQASRLQATEAGRAAEASAASLAQVLARQQVRAAQSSPANQVVTLHFDFGSTRFNPPDANAPWVAAAREAPLVMLRGRTDGTRDSLAESRIARERAVVVRDFLIAAGVAPGRIRSTHQPVGDPVADNASASGRGLNRRVEVELYQALPVQVSAGRP